MSSKPKTTRLDRAPAQPTADELLHFFNQSPDLLCIAGFDGVFKRLNPAWSPLLGWTNAELQARPFLDFVHPDDRPATLAVMDHFDTGAATLSFENRYRCKDGSWKWLRWTASPLLDRQEIYASARDITHQKLLELQILAAAESEQQRISRDLHDSLGPHLAAKVDGKLQFNLDTKKLIQTFKCYILQVMVTDSSTGESRVETLALQVK